MIPTTEGINTEFKTSFTDEVIVSLVAFSNTKGVHALMLGITFKENCPDIRNTKAIDIYNELVEYGMEVDVYDPWSKPEEVMHEYGITSKKSLSEDGTLSLSKWGVIILAVAHNQFLSLDLKSHKNNGAIIYDVKGILNKGLTDGRL